MAGLLDNQELMQGLLGFGGNMLANNTGHYGAFGPAFGAGVQGFGKSYYGAIQQKKDNDERTKRLAMLEAMQGSQIAENESQERLRQSKMDQEAQLQAARARLYGATQLQPMGLQPTAQPQGLGGMPAQPVAPDAVSGAQLQIPRQDQMPQAMPIAENEVPQVDVTSARLALMQNPDALRALATQFQGVGASQDAAHFLALAEKAEAGLNREEDKSEKTFIDNQGIHRYIKDGQPVAQQQKKAPEGMQWGEDGQLTVIPGFLDMKKQIASAGATKINVGKEQTEEAKAVGKFQGEQYADIQKAGFNAQARIDRYDRMAQLLNGVDTGRLTPFATDVAAFAQSLGLNIDKNLGNKQAAEALANEVTLQMRNPAGGAGMPGALSDKDREFLKAMAPGLAKTPEGRKQIMDTAIKIAKRDKEVAKLARKYRKKSGKMDEGFYEVLEEFSAKNPLFGETGDSTSGWSIKKLP